MLDHPKVWTGVYEIHTYHLDANERASVAQMCSFLFDAAGNHAYDLGFAVPELKETNMTWVLSRFKAVFDYYPKWKERIYIQSWPSGNERLFAYRQFLIFNTEKLPIGRASSAWLLIDLKSRRPLRPETLFSRADVIYHDNSYDERPGKLKYQSDSGKGSFEDTRTFEVLYSDLDLNNHVTSVSYIKWILETIPLEKRNTMFLNTLQINYLAEAHYGETLEVSTIDIENGRQLIHSISRQQGINSSPQDENTKARVAIAHTSWKRPVSLPE